jgi:hypothetical protein
MLTTLVTTGALERKEVTVPAGKNYRVATFFRAGA